MKLTEKTLGNGIVLTMPEQALPIVKEIWEQEVYNKEYVIKEDDIVIDIGANVGIFSLYAAAKGAKVYCFEPNPIIYEILLMNIQKNALERQIIPFNIALGGADGFIDLYVANSDKIYSAGSASTNMRYIEDLEQRIGGDFERYTVACRKLEDVTSELGLERVDLIKLDCEGAEFEIIKNTSDKTLQMMENLALELHGACYSQKELCRLFAEKGLYIDRLIEIAEPFLIGYLYGSREKKPDSGQLVAVIDSKEIGYSGETVLFDAVNSFLTHSREEHFNYRWIVDDVAADRNTSRMECQFNIPGFHQVKLEVEWNGLSASAAREILVLKADYDDNQANCELGGLNSEFIATIDAEKTFSIDGGIIPKLCHAESIVISVNKIRSNQGVFGPLRFEFNGNPILLNQRYHEIRLGCIPSNFDVVFSIAPQKKGLTATDIDIRWWVCSGKTQTNVEAGPRVVEGNETAFLSALGEHDYFYFGQEKSFIIKKEMLPTTWVPKEIVIGIASERYKRLLFKLSGSLVYGEELIPISEWYSEIRLHPMDFESDISFKLNMLKANGIKIVWWCA